MKKWEYVTLNKELDELNQKGIHKGYDGLITDIHGDIYTVWFTNSKNKGELACAKIHKKYLILNPNVKLDSRLLEEIKEFVSNAKIEKYTHLTECDVKEYDVVELIAEKQKYAIEGVHKGDRGCVISTYAIDNHWEIIFSERETGKDIAQIGVAREDFKIIDKF
ncbi:MAG: hypothetical protein IJV80_01060 [Clostridia bacterium]|nr:hypothetical protein [Clostridia bacterium]